MTGEITLSGLVLPVGGIREKALAAMRTASRIFILPARNESGPRGAAAGAEARHAFHPRAHTRRSFACGAAGRDNRGRKMTRCAVLSSCCTLLHWCVSPRHGCAARADRRDPGTGTITGHVKLTARVRSPLPSNVYPSRTIGKHAGPTIPEIRNVVVYLKDPGVPRHADARRSPSCGRRTRRSSRTCWRSRRGSTVEFPNDDPFFHNVFSLSSTATFNLGRYPRGETRGQRSTSRAS